MNQQSQQRSRAMAAPRRITAAAAVLSAAGLALVALQPHFAGAKPPAVDASISDRVLVVDGTAKDDAITLSLRAGDPSTLTIDGHGDGLSEISVNVSEFDQIVVNAGAGDDEVRILDFNGAFTTTHPTTINGEAGDDTLTGGLGGEALNGGPGNDNIHGGDGVDTIDAGPGNDFADGDRGVDVAFLGSGNDTFQWDPGDGSDTVEGEAGVDTMLFFGSNQPEVMDLSANGGRLRFFRNVGTIVMDTDNVEVVDVDAAGSADLITVHDLSATDVTAVNVDLAAIGGGGDAAADRVVVEGTAGDDSIVVGGDASGVTVSGLAATVGVVNAEAAFDTLEIDGLGGVNNVDASTLTPGMISFVVN